MLRSEFLHVQGKCAVYKLKKESFMFNCSAHAEFEVAISNMSPFYRPNTEITQFANDAESMRQM